jgi:tetratricopeptide (TPR) repeat protein
MRPGDLVAGRFEVGAIAGSGGMGTVFRARDRATGLPVAFKVLERVGPEYVTRFEREARVLSSLEHPRIVRYIAHGATPEGKRYIAMEWLEGMEVEALLARRELAPDEAVGVVLRAAEALAVAHERGIVHRDVKPGNLFLVDGDIERLKVLDFGVARLNLSARIVTKTGDPVGTPGYMAPEQARGEREVTPRADVFALGCVLFECLTRRPPFIGKHVMSVLAKVLFEDAPRVKELRADVPAPLDDLVARLLSKDPSARPKDAAEVMDEIQRLGSLARIKAALPSRPADSLTRGEQRLLSVVVAGHPGKSIHTSERTMTPEESRATRAIWDTVAEFGPTLEWLANGAVVATLSGRGTATDQAAVAARCALAMRRKLQGIPMALATGRGDVSGRLPLGEVIDRAVQLVAADTPNVRIDDVTAGLLSPQFDVVEDEHGLVLRGELGAEVPRRTLLGKPTPCVGRERELAMVEGIYAESVDESIAHVVLVTAAAGVGKSRFLKELLPRLQKRRQCEVFVGRGDPMSAGSPYLMLRRAAVGPLGRDEKTWRAAFEARVGRNLAAEDARRVTDFLGELLGITFPAEGRPHLEAARADPPLMREQIRRAWIDFLDADSKVSPIALVLEDLQWGDAPTVKLIDLALERFSDRPLFVLALARPEVDAAFPRLWAGRRLTRISLRELSRKASETLVREVLGESVSPERVGAIVERAGGNAFFLEELIRAEAEGKGAQAPETVLAMVQARLEHLDPDVRRVLRAASVFGQVFWKSGVAALLAKTTADLDPTFAELRRRELVEPRSETRFPGEEELTFRHALVREAAHGMLTQADLALGHRLAAEWLTNAGERDATTLAEHFELGGDLEGAAARYLRAAQQALDASDMDATLARVEKSLACGAKGPELGMLRAIEAEAHVWRGDYPRAEAAGHEAMSLLAPDSSAWSRAASWTAAAAGPLGHKDQLVSIGRAVSDVAPTGRTRVLAQARVAMQLLNAGEYEVADRLIDRLVSSRAPIAHDPNIEGTIHQLRAQRALVAGDPGDALDLASAAASAFERAGNAREACYERQGVALSYMQLGAWSEAEHVLRGVLEVAERLGLARLVATVKHNLGLVAAHLGRPEAKRLEAEGLDGFLAHGDKRLAGAAHVYMALIHALERNPAASEAEARRAIESASNVPPVLAYAKGVLARALCAQGRADEAASVAADATALLDELGAIEEGEAIVRLARAEAALASGREDEAREAIARAKRRVLERAANIRDERWRKSFLENVPEVRLTLELRER